MSWMNVLGKIYHCVECGYSIKVDYKPIEIENGYTHFTQVGDDNIMLWYELHRKYEDSEDVYIMEGDEENNEEYFVYLHEELVCQKCFEKNMRVNSYIREQTRKYERLTQLCEMIEEIILNYSLEISGSVLAELEKIINSTVPSDLKEIDPELYEKTIGNRFVKLRGKRDKLINDFIEPCREKIIRYLEKKIENNNSTIKYFADKFEEYVREPLQEMKELSTNKFDKVYISKSINKAENLNRWVGYLFTFREPVEETPEILFYNLISVDKEEITEFINDINRYSIFLIPEDECLKDMKERLWNYIESIVLYK